MNAPAWLTQREGDLKPGVKADTWAVTLSGHPLYVLFVTTAKGQFTCVITLTNNGQRLDGGKTYPSLDAAFAGGLEELREKLGW
jgi:hypothetical protein